MLSFRIYTAFRSKAIRVDWPDDFILTSFRVVVFFSHSAKGKHLLRKRRVFVTQCKRTSVLMGRCVFVAHCKGKVRRCVLRKNVSVKRYFFFFFSFCNTVQKDKLLDEKMQCASPSPNQHHRDGCLSITLDIRGFRLPCEHIKGSNEKHIKSSKEKHIKGST